MTPTLPPEQLYGYMAEFDDAAAIVEAARRLAAAGYEQFEAFTPFLVEELEPHLNKSTRGLGMIILGSGIFGGLAGYLMQWYACVISYPINVGGRPLHSWPSFLAITFEMTVLFASFGAFFGTLLTNELPQVYHPVFNVPEFKRASRDRFFLCLEGTDGHFEREASFDFMRALEPLALHEVPK